MPKENPIEKELNMKLVEKAQKELERIEFTEIQCEVKPHLDIIVILEDGKEIPVSFVDVYVPVYSESNVNFKLSAIPNGEMSIPKKIIKTIILTGNGQDIPIDFIDAIKDFLHCNIRVQIGEYEGKSY